MGLFLFATTFRPALRRTQPPIHWIPGLQGSYPGDKTAGAWNWPLTSN